MFQLFFKASESFLPKKVCEDEGFKKGILEGGWGEWDNWATGVKEGTGWNEPWVLHAPDESRN